MSLESLELSLRLESSSTIEEIRISYNLLESIPKLR
jgi:hypothetical protein